MGAALNAATAGDASAMLAVGLHFIDGPPSDAAMGWAMWRNAAGQGSSSAQNSLAMRCMSGVGVPRNAAEAVRLYRLGAEQGYPEAMVGLAGALADGAPPLPGESPFALWRRAAELGHSGGALRAARCLLAGAHGAAADEEAAVGWLERVAALPTRFQEEAVQLLREVRGPGAGGSGARGGGASAQDPIANLLIAVEQSLTPIPPAFFAHAGDSAGQIAVLKDVLFTLGRDPMAGRAPPLAADDATGRLFRSLFRREARPDEFYRRCAVRARAFARGSGAHSWAHAHARRLLSTRAPPHAPAQLAGSRGPRDGAHHPVGDGTDQGVRG